MNKENETIFDIQLIVQCLDKGIILSGYSGNIKLPFIPTVGMKFKKDSSDLWKTKCNDTLNPSIEKVIYDIDEECFSVTFNIPYKELTSSFWQQIENIGDI